MNFASDGEISSPQTRYLAKVAELTERIHTESIATFRVKVEDGWILVAL
jgi:hypothetical protein